MSRLFRSVATVFGAGYLPFAQGTMASLIALLVYYFTKGDSNICAFIITTSLVVGFITVSVSEKSFAKKDPKEIVIDEFIGMFVSLYLLPFNIYYTIGAFCLFRFFDILKPFPIKRIERFSGSVGIIMDDVAAGIYANIILQVVRLLIVYAPTTCCK